MQNQNTIIAENTYTADQINDFGKSAAYLLRSQGGEEWKRSIEKLFQEWLVSFNSDPVRRDEVLSDYIRLTQFFDDLAIVELDHD